MKKSAVILGALILVLLLVAGTVAFVKSPSTADSLPNVSVDASLPNNVVEVPTEGTKELPLPTPAPEAPTANAPAEDAPVAQRAEPSPEPEAPARRVLVATESSGTPVSLNFKVEWRIDTNSSWTTQRVKTGADGRAELDAPPEAMLRLNLEERDWLLSWSDVTIPGGSIDASITAYAVIPLRVRVTYADGKPYVGLLSVTAKGMWQAGLQMVDGTNNKLPVPVGWPARPGADAPAFHEIVEFAGLPAGVTFTFETFPTRAGYGEVKSEVTPTEISSGELIEIVVPEGISPRTPGKIVLIPSDNEKVEGRSILFKVLADGTKRTGVWGSKDPLASGNVWAGRYVVVLLGAKAWHSEEFDLAPGEVKELQPTFTAAASLSARVVDENGEPVKDAVLAFATQDVPRSIMYAPSGWVRSPAGEATSGAQGVVSLVDLPAGTFQFQIHARGMQPWEGYATLVAGQNCDLGDVRLEAAKGRIEVQLPDWDFKKRKLTWSVTDSEGQSVLHGTVESSTFVIEGVPVGRTYKFRTGITLQEGSRAFWWTKAFELTHAAPTHKLDGTGQKWPSDLD